MPYYGDRIRAARGYAHLTQDELAERLGVDPATIKRRELPRGHDALQEPKKGERLAIAQICGVPPEFMEAGFGGTAPTEVSQRLEALEGLLRDIQRELAVLGLEGPQQTAASDQPAGRSRPARRP